MPTYEFICTTCGRKFEKRLHYSDDPSKVVCPNGHATTQKQFSVPTIVYKGSGFYTTDHPKKPKPATVSK